VLSNSSGVCEGVSPLAIGGIAGFGAAMLGALWAYDGWSTLSIVSGEVKNPQRNIPPALMTGMATVIILYVFTNSAYFYVLSPTEIANVSGQSAVATEVVKRFLGSGAAIFMAICLLTSSSGSMYTGILGAARIPYAMAQDRLFFQSMGSVSLRTHVPVTALLIQGIWISILALSGTFDTLTDYAMFASWIFYGMVTVSLFLFRKRLPDAQRPYRTWGYPVVPALFLCVTVWLLVNTVLTAPMRSLIGLILICAGLPLYDYFLRKNRIVEP
jgi:APA family basic amino acid/polyamine antiporter